ncbi:hypothetical protein RRG08_011704 [Elysia crispata]|uniref:Uncharacterized protein n=1 Tax=Elysia crispata TaxID=231223 RepID=A0AAE1EF95_9GAST|nr:hypothetical protein RRG08_011704 [Elysia crispata]
MLIPTFETRWTGKKENRRANRNPITGDNSCSSVFRQECSVFVLLKPRLGFAENHWLLVSPARNIFWEVCVWLAGFY